MADTVVPSSVLTKSKICCSRGSVTTSVSASIFSFCAVSSTTSCCVSSCCVSNIVCFLLASFFWKSLIASVSEVFNSFFAPSRIFSASSIFSTVSKLPSFCKFAPALYGCPFLFTSFNIFNVELSTVSVCSTLVGGTMFFFFKSSYDSEPSYCEVSISTSSWVSTSTSS